MGFNDWIYFEHKAHASVAHAEEVESVLKTKLAAKLQERLRSRVAPGLGSDEAARAGSIRAYAASGSIVIDEDDQGKILQRVTKHVDESDQGNLGGAEAMDVNDLFRQSDGIPKVIRRPDGSSTVAFRTIDLGRLFGAQTDLRDQEIQKVVTDTLQGGMVESFEESVDEIERTYPSHER